MRKRKLKTDCVELRLPVEGFSLTQRRRRLLVTIFAPVSSLEMLEAGLATDTVEGVLEYRPVMVELLYSVFERFAQSESQTVVCGFGLEFQGSYRRTKRSIEITMELLPEVKKAALKVIFQSND